MVMRVALALTVVFVAAALVQIAHYGPLLPDRVATHFDGAGRPDDFATRDGFLVGYAVFLAFMAAVFAGLCLVIGRIPARFVNMPHRDYWLAPERRDEALGVLRTFLMWELAVTLLLGVVIGELTIRANLSESGQLEDAWLWAFMGFWLLLQAGLIVAMFMRLRIPKAAAG